MPEQELPDVRQISAAEAKEAISAVIRMKNFILKLRNLFEGVLELLLKEDCDNGEKILQSSEAKPILYLSRYRYLRFFSLNWALTICVSVYGFQSKD